MTKDFLIPGFLFTGTNGDFDGRIEFIKFNDDQSKMVVNCTKKHVYLPSGQFRFSAFHEVWTTETVLWAFQRGDYYEKTELARR